MTHLSSALAGSAIADITFRLLLCSAYIWSGVTKLLAFNATAQHFASRFGLPAPRAAAALTIFVQLTGSAVVISGWMSTIGAAALALFTIAATVTAYPFWKMAGTERMRSTETFLEHLGLTAVFVVLALPSV